MVIYYGKWDTGHDEPPHQVDIPTALRNVGVALYDDSRAYDVYIRYIRGKDLYDTWSIRQLQELCNEKRLRLRGMPAVYPGPVSHPWVQESFRRLHAFLVEALEKSEIATTFERFLDLHKGLRFKIYKRHFNQLCDETGLTPLVAPPAITLTSHQVRKEALPIFFKRNFVLRTTTKDPTLHASFLPPPPAPGLGSLPDAKDRKRTVSSRFPKAPSSYSINIRRLSLCRFSTTGDRADGGVWYIDLDAEKVEKRVTWIAGAGHGERFDEKGKKKVEKGIADATSRLRKCVDVMMERDGKLLGSDSLIFRDAIESNGKK
ncbi:uncharacterized protein MYCFIDRAFT_195745 [Pseudocercospora fijiensis CIRAD86]|uniref:Uncharacterized protein n=1 Tax=Pseudocercospora fijiensis (strain CIRAD86) TaxID=383855 RepID=M2Z4R6_PSEFD|nr:uncharacterized protein MYCFIDRAFT_195745 [Pseudocercospora fijiensis CIRAD86]EME84785.1 hypothetical protein MYCFIDRAFT_195745 [Pseudocercospora fijiensis CIRAD86]